MSQGRKAKLYVNTGTNGSPVWLEITRAMNVSMKFGKGEVKDISRGSEWEKALSGLKTVSLDCTYNRKLGSDTAETKFLDSYFNDGAIEVAVMNRAITVSGARGFRAYMQVFDLEDGAELESKQEFSFTLKLTEYEEGGNVIEPSRYVVP